VFKRLEVFPLPVIYRYDKLGEPVYKASYFHASAAEKQLLFAPFRKLVVTVLWSLSLTVDDFWPYSPKTIGRLIWEQNPDGTQFMPESE